MIPHSNKECIFPKNEIKNRKQGKTNGVSQGENAKTKQTSPKSRLNMSGMANPSFVRSFLPSFLASFLPSFLPAFMHSHIHAFITFCAQAPAEDPCCRSKFTTSTFRHLQERRCSHVSKLEVIPCCCEFWRARCYKILRPLLLCKENLLLFMLLTLSFHTTSVA